MRAAHRRTGASRSAATEHPTSAASRRSIGADSAIGTAGSCRRFPAFTTISRCRRRIVAGRSPGRGAKALDDDTPTRAYFDLIRNFRRDSWLLIYLFGASPAVCAVVRCATGRMGSSGLDETTLSACRSPPSLQDGSPGLSVERPVVAARLVQQSCRLFRDLVEGALTMPYPPYRSDRAARCERRNTSSSAPRCCRSRTSSTVRSGPSAAHAFRRAAAGRAERAGRRVRRSAVPRPRPFPAGGHRRPVAFTLPGRVPAWHACSAQSPPDSPEESARIQANQSAVVDRGRDAEPAELYDGNGVGRLRNAWASRILDDCAVVAEPDRRCRGRRPGPQRRLKAQRAQGRATRTYAFGAHPQGDTLRREKLSYFRLFALNAVGGAQGVLPLG